MLKKGSHIHFVGIGGIGMSGLAKILRCRGFRISGCDLDLDQKSVADLLELGCEIYSGNDTKKCRDSSIDILVYSSAVNLNSSEILLAKKRGMPVVSRGKMLAEIMRSKFGIAVAGTHGKTSTSSLLSHVLLNSGFDPTIAVGGYLNAISSNAKFGSDEIMIAEADESDKSLLHLVLDLAVITSIDRDHMNNYKDLDEIKKIFLNFLSNITKNGKAILCLEDPGVRSILPLEHKKFVTYGFSKEADLCADNLSFEGDFSCFDVYHSGELLGRVSLKMLGEHNVLNSLAVILVALELDIPFAKISEGLSNFAGVERRFTFRKFFRGAEIFDDYAHHPSEIDRALTVACGRSKKGIVVIFQPHRYTRTFYFWDDFINVFLKHKIDNLIVTDIFPASEVPIDGVDSRGFVEDIKVRDSQKSVFYLPIKKDFSALRNKISAIMDGSERDLIFLLGAGNLYRIVDKM